MKKTLHEEIEAILQDAAVEHFRIPHHTKQLEQAFREAVERAYPAPTPDDSIDPLDQFKTNLLEEISGEGEK